MSVGHLVMIAGLAALLAALVNILDVPEMTVSSSGLREGLLYQSLDQDTRAQDPLIVAAEFEGRRLARFAPHGRAIADWIAPLCDYDPPVNFRWPEYVTTPRGRDWWIPSAMPGANTSSSSTVANVRGMLKSLAKAVASSGKMSTQPTIFTPRILEKCWA